MTKLLIVFPYWSGDHVQMEKSVRLACDLLDKKNDQVELLFLARFDSNYPSPDLFQHALNKFRDVKYWRCNRGGNGFPEGCSELAYGLFQYVIDQRRMNSVYLDIDAMLIMEADCVFTRRSWVEELCAEWENAKAQNKLVVGALQESGRWDKDVGEHINAVGIYDIDLLRIMPCLSGGAKDIGWDYYHREGILPITLNSKLFKLDWQKPSILSEDLFKDLEVLVYHGIKDDSAVRAIRERFNL